MSTGNERSGSIKKMSSIESSNNSGRKFDLEMTETGTSPVKRRTGSIKKVTEDRNDVKDIVSLTTSLSSSRASY